MNPIPILYHKVSLNLKQLFSINQQSFKCYSNLETNIVYFSTNKETKRFDEYHAN